MTRETQRRTVAPCWPEDRLEQGGAGRGRPTTAHGYSRAGIAAEAGVTAKTVGAAARSGKLLEASPYSVVAYVARARARELLDQVDVDADTLLAALRVLELLELLSLKRQRGG